MKRRRRAQETRSRPGRGNGGSGGTLPVHECQHCGKTNKRWDYHVKHLREVHSVEHEAAPPYEPPDSDDDPLVQPVAPDGPVNHALSGPPSAPFWDWDKSSEGYKARTAVPDVSGMGLPRSILEEFEEQMRFINTDCKSILEKITRETSLQPAALLQWEADKKTFDECTSRLALFA